MKDYPYVPGWRQNKKNNKPAIKHSVLMFSKYGISEGEWNGNEWIQYRWNGKFKDSDVLYWMHLEDFSQLEKEGDLSLQRELPEVDEPEYGSYARQYPTEVSKKQLAVDLNEETITKEFHTIADKYFTDGIEGWQREKLIARHFYELGLNARKED